MTALLKSEEICGPVHPILANYILYLIRREIGSPDAEQFGDLLLESLSPAPHYTSNDSPSSSTPRSQK